MNSESITLFLNHEKIVSDLCQQITKDINEDDCVIHLKWSTQSAFADLFQQIFPVIERLEKTNQSKLNFILNRTDISEIQLKQAIKKNKSWNNAQIISDLIIKRELQKVVIRSHFKNI